MVIRCDSRRAACASGGWIRLTVWCSVDALRGRVGLPGRPLPCAPHPALRNSTAHAARDPDSDSARAFSVAGRKEKRVLIGPPAIPGSGALNLCHGRCTVAIASKDNLTRSVVLRPDPAGVRCRNGPSGNHCPDWDGAVAPSLMPRTRVGGRPPTPMLHTSVLIGPSVLWH